MIWQQSCCALASHGLYEATVDMAPFCTLHARKMRFYEVGDLISDYRHWSQHIWTTLLSYLLITRGKIVPRTWRWTLPLPNVKVNNGCSHSSTTLGFNVVHRDINILLIFILLNKNFIGPDFPVSVIPFPWAAQPARNVILDASFTCNKTAVLGES